MAAYFDEKKYTKKLRIADLNVKLTFGGDRVLKQSVDYIYDYAGESDIKIVIERDVFERVLEKNPHLGYDMCEYLLTGSRFYAALLAYSGFMLHSSAVVYENRAYLFSAPCGTGKSTHTSLWCKRFGDAAVILNDDKPAIRFVDGKFYAYGTPWSGKTSANINMRVPLGAIAFIERAEKNSIERLDVQTAFAGILSQTLRIKDVQNLDKVVPLVESLVKNVNVYKLKCNMELDAVDVAYNAMSKDC